MRARCDPTAAPNSMHPLARARLVDYLRPVHARPGGTGAILNLILAAKVRGAADLSALSCLVSDPMVAVELARHGADEANHAYRILQRMNELRVALFRPRPELDRAEGLLTRCRARDVKQVYSDRDRVREADLMEFTAALVILERDAVFKLWANHEALTDDLETRALIASIAEDDERHLGYLHDLLSRFERRFSARAVERTMERLDELFSQLSFVYYGALEDYFSRATS